MKKKLEAELISIAHRILKMRNGSELKQLQKEAQQLYEKLSVLMFVEEHFSGAKPTIGRSDAENLIETVFEKEPEAESTASNAETPVAEDTRPDEEETAANEEEIQEPEKPQEEKLDDNKSEVLETPAEKEVDQVIAEAEAEVSQADAISGKETDIAPEREVEETSNEENTAEKEELFKPSFEWAFEAKSEEKPEQAIPNQATEEPSASGQIAFEDLLGAGYVDPVFVKPEDSGKPVENFEPILDELKSNVISISRHDDKVPVLKMDKVDSLNDRLAKGSIIVGLNDRIAFVKNLFNNSNEDYNRVLSQLLTFDTYRQAEDFINNMVKPDYNNWEGKDELAERFMEVVEKKFA